MKTVIILRGVSGSGKSLLAEHLTNNGTEGVVCSADSFMYEDGEYVFAPSKLAGCHAKCKARFCKALLDMEELVVVDNTHGRLSEYAYYEEQARAASYRVFVLVVENTGTRSEHGVPDATLARQAANIKSSLRLLPE